MTKVKLNKVVLENVDAAVIVAKVDNRTNNPGRPVNKQSARYKRLAKQAFYTKQNKSFVRHMYIMSKPHFLCIAYYVLRTA